MRRLIRLVAWFAALCALLLGAPPDVRFAAKSLGLLYNLKHCHQAKFEPRASSCTTLLKINIQLLFIWLLIFVEFI